MRQTDFVMPNSRSLFVVGIDRHPEFFGGNGQRFGQEFPGKGNRFGFKVIAKTKVTQHFKKGVVACGITYVFEIVMLASCAHTAL